MFPAFFLHSCVSCTIPVNGDKGQDIGKMQDMRSDAFGVDKLIGTMKKSLCFLFAGGVIYIPLSACENRKYIV